MSLEPGRELQIHSFSYYSKTKEGISGLVKLPLHELVGMEHDSIGKEQAIYDKMCALEKEWTEQAQCTGQIRKALQYLQTPPTPHTANVWKANRYDLHEISNMVYKMSWRVYEDTRYDKATGKSIPVSWYLSWYLTFNTPREPDNSGHGWQLAGQDRKRFTDKAVMEKYLQGRIDAYAHLFTKISPPIPKGEEGRFSVNGVLLPGYTVEVPEKSPQEIAGELLDFLEDEDTPLPPPTEPKKSQHQGPSHPAHKKPPPRKQRDSAPTR